jgi:hypothetical protein
MADPMEEYEIAHRVLKPALERFIEHVKELRGGARAVRQYEAHLQELEAYYKNETVIGPLHF